MGNPLFKLDFNGNSPLQVFDGAGNVMFDARYAAMRVEQVGSFTLYGRSWGGSGGTDAYTNIALARPRASGVYPITTGFAFTQPVESGLTKYWTMPSVDDSGTAVSQTRWTGWLMFSRSTYLQMLEMSPAIWGNLSGYDGTLSGRYCVFNESVGV